VTVVRQLAGGEQTASAQDSALDLLARHPEGLTVAEIADLHELLRAYQSGHIKPE